MNALKWIAKFIIAGFLSIFLITVFSYWYSFSGIHITNRTGATDYTWEPGQRKATMGEGFAFLNMDQNGYNNSYPSRDSVDTLLMGSSHMEAVNVDSDKNAGYILNEIIPGYTYNIGMSGHTIYRCVKNLDAALAEYHPTNIIIETDKVELDVNEMRQVIEGEMSVIPSYDSGALYYIQKYVPGIKVLYNKISDWACVESEDEKDGDIEERSESNIQSDEYRTVLDMFLTKAVTSLSEDQRILIVYQPKTRIDQSGAYVSTNDNEYSKVFQEVCDENGIGFLDLSDSFEELYLNENFLAHGFMNTAVGEGHMNEQGHRIFAEKSAEYMKTEWEVE